MEDYWCRVDLDEMDPDQMALELESMAPNFVIVDLDAVLVDSGETEVGAMDLDLIDKEIPDAIVEHVPVWVSVSLDDTPQADLFGQQAAALDITLSAVDLDAFLIK